MVPRLLALGVVLGLAAGGCGSSSTETSTVAHVIIIDNYTFSPQRLEVPPGATVVVLNQDSVLHSVTSEADAGDYVYGTVNGIGFDTGPFLGTKSFVVSSDAPNGTIIPYFCTQSTSAMLDQGSIEVVAAADGG